MTKITFSKPDRPTHMKIGIYGAAGSGKTHTSALLAIGIVEELRKLKSKAADKPVYMFDTEKGSDWIAPLFKEHKIEFRVLKSRAFIDLLEATKLAEKEASVFIVDSLNHVWKELLNAYLKKTGKDRIPMYLWEPIKEQWGEFTTNYLNSKLHIIAAGRAQGIYEYVTNEETGKKEFVETDTRMGGEKQMSYEPDLLIEMKNIKELDKTGRSIRTHRAFVEKDKSDTLEEKYKKLFFDDPNFETFRPVWEELDVDGKGSIIDTKRDSQALVSNQDRNVADRNRRRTVAAEEIQGMLVKYIPGQAASDKAEKVKILQKVFGTTSWTKVTEDWKAVPLEMIEAGVKKVEALAKAYTGIVPEVKPAKKGAK